MSKKHRTGSKIGQLASEAAPRDASAVTAILDTNSHYEEVAALAYRYWQERGCPEGSDQEDWFRAESKIRSRASDDPIAEE